MSDAAVYDAIRPLEANWEHYKREVETLTSGLATELARHQNEREDITEALAEAIRRRDVCYAALRAAKEAVSGL